MVVYVYFLPKVFYIFFLKILRVIEQHFSFFNYILVRSLFILFCVFSFNFPYFFERISMQRSCCNDSSSCRDSGNVSNRDWSRALAETSLYLEGWLVNSIEHTQIHKNILFIYIYIIRDDWLQMVVKCWAVFDESSSLKNGAITLILGYWWRYFSILCS